MPDSSGAVKALLARAGDCWCAIPLEDLRRVEGAAFIGQAASGGRQGCGSPSSGPSAMGA